MDDAFPVSSFIPLARILWQVTAAISLVWIATRWLSHKPALGSWLWRLAICKCGIALLLPFSLQVPIPGPFRVSHQLPSDKGLEGDEAPLPPQITPLTSTPGSELPVTAGAEQSKSIPMLGILWVFGMALVVCGWMRRWFRLLALVRHATPADGMRVEAIVSGLADKLGLRRLPRVLIVTPPVGPLVTGLWRPVIVLPQWLTHQDDDEVRAALAHELAHVRRRDVFWNLLAALVGLPLFPYPLIWLARRELRVLQESAADQLALRVTGGEASAYASLLLRMAEAGRGPFGPQPALLMASRSYLELHERIRAMTPFPSANRGRGLAACVCGVALVGLLPWHPVIPTGIVPASAEELQPASAKADDRNPEIDAALERLRKRDIVVREKRGFPTVLIQEDKPGIDDSALEDIEIVARDRWMNLVLIDCKATRAGLERLATVKTLHLSLRGDNVDDALLEALPKLRLENLSLNADRVNDVGLKPLGGCQGLKRISLTGNGMTDGCLEYLKGLPELESVSLGKNFSRNAFDILKEFKALKDFSFASLPSIELSDLIKLPNLRKLHLSGKEYDDETARLLAEKLSALERVDLLNTSITNAGVRQLGRLENLAELTLDGAPIDDEIADTIRGMKRLVRVSLRYCEVGDRTAAAIAAHPEMWWVSLSSSKLTDAGVAELAKLKRLNGLYLWDCIGVTDASVEHLIKLPNTKTSTLGLNIQMTGISQEGARKLQSAMPHSSVTWSPSR